MRPFSLSLFLFVQCIAFSQNQGWETYFERSGGTETPRYLETISFLHGLSDISNKVNLQAFGKSAQGRDLFVAIVDREGLTSPSAIREAGRIVVLIQACIHPGECEGKDAGLMLIRDLIVGKKFPGLLDHLSILFIPIFNVDGHERFGPYNRINQNGPKEMGWRVTAQNLNLNRDYLKAETPEMQAWLSMFNKWLPDFFIDTHTTDGADYQYVLTYDMEVFGGMDEGLTKWCKSVFLPAMTSEMERNGYPVFPYIEFRDWNDPTSGIESTVAPPMLSQGYTSLRNRPGLLIETHMLKPYQQRVHSTYQCIVSSLGILNMEFAGFTALVRKADEFTSSQEFRDKEFPLHFKNVAGDSTIIDFLGIKYDLVKSEITGETWFKYGNEKITMKLPYFSNNRPSEHVKLPEAYIIPVEWKSVIDKLIIHGVRIAFLRKDTILSISTYRFSNAKWQPNPYEGHHSLIQFDASPMDESRLFRAGSVIVDMAQPAARIIAHMLEPKGNGSLVSWGFFDAVFEQKEYSEHYVMEPLIMKMLTEKPGLKEEFEKKKHDDPAFTKNTNQVLNWFFSKTPYWDNRKDVYPVGKIFDRELIEKLILRY